jgi:hypothetical protein
MRINRLGFFQPVLNVQSRAGTPEDDITHERSKLGAIFRFDIDLDQIAVPVP